MKVDQKYKVGDIVFCVNASSYEIHLTKRKQYDVHAIGKESKEAMLRVKGDAGRLVWISELHFSLLNQPKIKTITLDDKIEDAKNDIIEVTVLFENGMKRWLFFMTAQYLIEKLMSPNFYFHSTKVIYVNALSEAIVEKTIRDLDQKNELMNATKPY